MVIPIIILVTIPIFLGIVAVSPFDQPEEFNEEIILEEPEFNDEIILEEPEFNDETSSEPGVNVLYFLLIVVWTIILFRMLLQIKKGTFKATKRY
jgi:NADH:ubiquinone oxidoreductase subunit 5 (subunit L)/multisubunit Na+/H+ antiporter MnhA subunit